MLEAFKIKEFDLEPVYASWKDAPRFSGDAKKSSTLDDWLHQIKAGCIERKVPEEYWHKVAQHYMEPKAKTRWDELKKVMAKVNGGKYRWTWKKFKVAMRSMGWEIDMNATEPVSVYSRPSGVFWITRKKSTQEDVARPSPVKMQSESAIVTTVAQKPRLPFRSNSTNSTDTIEPESAVTVSNAPTWLLNACHALDFLTAEHPRAMSTLSAILITAGTLPSIPAISAGAGGTILASGMAQAVGAIALGVGNWLKAQQEGQVQASNSS